MQPLVYLISMNDISIMNLTSAYFYKIKKNTLLYVQINFLWNVVFKHYTVVLKYMFIYFCYIWK